MASCDFYQIMIQSMRENYPMTCGILPWCFKRPWTTTAIQLVDGLGEPIAPYYYVKNAYASLSAHLALREVTYAPGEEITPDLRLICDGTQGYAELTVGYEIYSPQLACVRREEFFCDITPAEYQKSFACAAFTLPEDYTEKYFFLRAYVKNSTGQLHQSVYWCKVLSRLGDETVLSEFRKRPQLNIDFETGPWLKPQITALPLGSYSTAVLSKSVQTDGGERRLHLRVRIENRSTQPLFPMKLEVLEDKTLMYSDDNDFFLAPETVRELELEIRIRDEAAKAVTLAFTAWNAALKEITIAL
jgi:beta-mannosidase